MSAAAGLSRCRDEWAEAFVADQESRGARHVAVWEGGGYRALLAFEPYGERPEGGADFRWHVSVSRRDGEIPTWDDMASIVHRLRPGVPMVIGIPPRGQWMSVPGVEVLHAVQVRDDNLTSRWAEEGTMVRAGA